MGEELEIYFEDLDGEAKERVLKFLGLEKPEDLNLDVFPLAVLSKPEE